MSERRGKVTAILCVLLAVSSAIAIVIFSGQSGGESNALSHRLTAWVISLLRIDNTETNRELLNLALRKLAHFSLYFLLGFGLTGGLAKKREKINIVLAVIVLGCLFAMTDEFHQRFSADRTPAVWDVLLDTCGVSAGCGVFEMLRWGRRGRK